MIHRLALMNQVIRLCKSLYLVILNLYEWFINNKLMLNIDKTKMLTYKDENIINVISINSTAIY